MKRLILPLLILFHGFGLPAQDNPVNLLPADKQSRNFEAVARYLDLGGPVYAYVDVDGDLSRLMGHVRDLLALLKDDVPGPVNAMLGNLNFEGILDALGLGAVQAFGLSSYQDGEVFHNKTFLLLEDGPQGLFRVMGDDPHPFTTWDMAPAGTDIVWEQDLNLKAVEEVVVSILQQVMGPPGAQMAEGVLQKKPVGQDFTWKELIEKLDTRVIAMARIDPAIRISVPVPVPGKHEIEYFDEDASIDFDAEPDLLPGGVDAAASEEEPVGSVAAASEPVVSARIVGPRMVEVPMVDFYISVENMGWLVDQADAEFENIQEIEKFSVNGWRGYGFGRQMPPGTEAYSPYLLHEVESGRLVIVSRPEYMNACLARSGGIRQDADFQQAVKGLPQAGNGFTYFSPDVVDVLGAVLVDFAEGEEDADKMLPWALGLLGHFKKPQAVVYTNQTDGVLIAANQVFSHKGNFFMAMVPNPAVLGALWFTGMAKDTAMSSHSFGEPDREEAMHALKEIGIAYFQYLEATDGADIPADVAGVHGWAQELAGKIGFAEAWVYRVHGDIALADHHGELANTVRDKSFPGMPFSVTLVAGLPADAPPATTPLAWTRGLRPDGAWSFDSPFFGEGGCILFRDGRVEFFETVEGALIDYQTKEPTSDITKAVPPGAKILEYEMPEEVIGVPDFELPEGALEEIQREFENVPAPDLKIPSGRELSTEPIGLPQLEPVEEEDEVEPVSVPPASSE